MPLLLLCACSGDGDDIGPGGVSAEDAEALDAAAATLDEQSSTTTE